jgi:hypothetical protein
MAIAFDNSTNGGQSYNSDLTFAHECSGDNRILFVFVESQVENPEDGVTYNGSEMTRIIRRVWLGYYLSVYYLIAPSSGSNNVVVDRNNAAYTRAVASSYTGVSQTSPIDASDGTLSDRSGTTMSASLTTIADNCWTIFGCKIYYDPTATAGAAVREIYTKQFFVADSNAAITPAGSHTMSFSSPSTHDWSNKLIVSFKPATSATYTQTIQSKSRIKTSGLAKTIQSKSRIKTSGLAKTIQSKSNIKTLGTSKTAQVKSRIKITGVSKTTQAKSRIKQSSLAKTTQAKSRLKQAGITKTAQAKGRIKIIGRLASVSAKSMIRSAAAKYISAKSYILTVGNIKRVSAKADIKIPNIPQATEVKSRIKIAGLAKTTQAKARLKQASLTKTAQAKGRIKIAGLDQTTQTKGRIKVTGVNKNIIAKSNIKNLGVNKTIATKAKIWAFRSGYVKMERGQYPKTLNDNRKI